MNKKSIYDFIGLKEGEEKTVSFFIGYSFFMGVAVAIFYTATTSLFLIAFERTMLPKAYIVGGFVVYGLGFITNKIEKKIRFTKLANVLIYFLMVSVTGLLVLYQFSEIKWFIFVLFVWNRVFVFVNGITFWSTAAKIFNIQQAKRLFGLIGAGEVFSSILSFFSVPLLLKFISTDDLLYIVNLAVVGCIVMMSLIVSRFSANLNQAKETPNADAKKADTRTWADFLKNPYYVMVFLLAMMPVVGLFFVDFMFAVESKKVYPDKELLASFLGVFFGFCAIFEIGIKTILYGKLMNKYGLKVGIILLPLALLFSVTLAASYGLFYGTTSLFFAFIVLSRFFMSAVRKSINEPSFQVLLQPIATPERAILQSRIEGGPKALGNIIPGVLLLILTSLSFIDTVHIATFFILILIGWFYLSLKTQSRYQNVLNALLQKSQNRASRSIDLYSYISYKLGSEKNKPSLNYEYNNFEFIVKLADSPQAQNRLLAAELLGESGRYFAYRYLARLMNDDSPEVKEAAIRAAGSLRKAELWPLLINHLHADRYHQSAAYALLVVGEPVLRELIRSFNRASGQTELQLRLIRLIRQIGGRDAVRFLRSLMNTSDAQVRDEVFESLKYLNYHARITERGYITTEIESRIELLVWLMASQRDLENYPPWSPIHIALEKEKIRVIPKIFTLLSLLDENQPYDSITELLVNEKQETYGYLLEVLNMTLPEEWKGKVIPLFEDRSIPERLKQAAEYFPNSRKAPGARLLDIINMHFTRVSLWLKVIALREIAQLEGNYTLIFAALASSPFEIIAEIALYELYKLDPTRFYELRSSMEDTGDSFHLQICDKVQTSTSEHHFLVHKVWVLSQTDFFSIYHEEELIPLATSLDVFHMPEAQSLGASVLACYDLTHLIVAAGQVQIHLADGTTQLLGAFDTYQIESKASSQVMLEALIDSEIFCMDDQKIKGLRLIGKPPETTLATETDVATG